ncbi:serine/threonine-protein kinase [Synechococcus sp. N5]|uniref:serine/threonine protein kinase n=1 Tax=Synechococcus sp. N5 TaxID=2575515 RepID=UPI000E0EBCEC|nr:serine/threonine-protein kinase [Synechococcus sp. N5]
MIDPRYELRILSGDSLEEVLEGREDSDPDIVIDALNVWIEHTDLIQAQDAQHAIEYLRTRLPDCLTEEIRLMIESESRRRAMFEPTNTSLDAGCFIGPSIHDGKGRYRIEELVGNGSQGSVYRATDRKFQSAKRSTVAIKVYKSPDALRRVRVPSIDHPNAVRVYDHDIDLKHSPLAYQVFEFLDGPTLDEWAEQKIVSINEISEILIQICNGVQAIHSLPIVHRDLKPSNIIMAEGRPVIADFGVAVDDLDDQTVAGSPLCMAPEQMRPNADSIAVDVYGIGGIAYFLITGTYPNGETELEALKFLSSRRSVDCSMVHGRMRRVVRKCLSRIPSERYASADGIRADVERIRRFMPTGAEGPIERACLFLRRNPWVAAVSLIVVAILVTIVINQQLQLQERDALRVQVEEMKGAFQKTVLDARLRDGELSPASMYTIAALSKRFPEWNIWSHAALISMEGELMLRDAVEIYAADPVVSRIDIAFSWWLLGDVQKAAGRPKDVSDASYNEAIRLFRLVASPSDPIVDRVKRSRDR